MALSKYFFNNLADLRDTIGVGSQFAYEEFEPHLKRSAIRYFRNNMGIGKPFFDELLTAFNAGSDKMTAHQKKAMEFFKPSLANFALYHFVPKAPLNWNSNGLDKIKDESHEPLKKWERDQAQASYLNDAFEDMENFLQFLEENNGNYTTWKNSEAYTTYKECFINTVSDFSNLFPMVQSRRTFLAIKPIMRRVEENKIKAVLGASAYDALKLKIKNNTALENDEKALMLNIQPAVANLVMTEAFTQLVMFINERGLQIMGEAAISDSSTTSESASGTPLIKLEQDTKFNGKEYLAKLQKLVTPDAVKTDTNKLDNRTYWL